MKFSTVVYKIFYNTMKTYKKFIALLVFGIFMANVEATVVIYLRKLYYPEGFRFPLKVISFDIVKIELIREISTIIMLFGIAYLSANSLIERFFYFIYTFGIWDIFYYLWLKLFLNWPLTFFDDDLLFLIPVPWISPVIAPVCISLCLIIFSLISISYKEKGFALKINIPSILIGVFGVILILFSFMYDFDARANSKSPVCFLYSVFFLGLIFIIAGFVYFIKGLVKENK